VSDNNVRVLTIEDLDRLSDLLRAVRAGAKMRWYPFGTDSKSDTPKYGTLVLRAFTRPDGTFYDFNKDVRDACVWMTGTFESFREVTDILKAMENAIDMKYGADAPMAIIDW